MNDMTLKFINVGYGEAIVLQCPDSRFAGGTFTMLIDGGSAEDSEFADRSSGRIPLWEYASQAGLDHIDLMVSTHTHEDHICGMLPVVQELCPAQLWQSLPGDYYRETRELDVTLAQNPSQDKFLHALNAYRTLCGTVIQHGGTIRTVQAGDSGELCEGLTYRVLAPSKAKAAELEGFTRELYGEMGDDTFLQKLDALDAKMNNYSVMLLLEYRGTRILLPGDTNCMGYGEIDPAALGADLFKIGHHGQKDGAAPEQLQAIRPKAIVCCASSDRRYNSAHPELMQSLLAQGISLWFSDCPPVPGVTVPPHRELIFTIGENGAFNAEYR